MSSSTLEASPALARDYPNFPVRCNRPKLALGEESVLLPENYQITKQDVINGRGRRSYNHIGNRRFRQLAMMNIKRYHMAHTKAEKTMIVHRVVRAMREACPSGGFLKKDRKSDRWVSIGGTEAREKVGHCLRDMIAAMKGGRHELGDVLNSSDKDYWNIDDKASKKMTTSIGDNLHIMTEMSKQQTLILKRLEEGFEGSVKDLVKGTK